LAPYSAEFNYVKDTHYLQY